MTPEQFCYWLQGFMEVGLPQGQTISKEQAEAIKAHLATVFVKVTPAFQITMPALPAQPPAPVTPWGPVIDPWPIVTYC